MAEISGMVCYALDLTVTALTSTHSWTWTMHEVGLCKQHLNLSTVVSSGVEPGVGGGRDAAKGACEGGGAGGWGYAPLGPMPTGGGACPGIVCGGGGVGGCALLLAGLQQRAQQ